jgi:hypothetical protein
MGTSLTSMFWPMSTSRQKRPLIPLGEGAGANCGHDDVDGRRQDRDADEFGGIADKASA